MTGYLKRLGFVLPNPGLALLICLIVPSQTVAQTLYGTILGDVKDETGAVIPSADVAATNQETNVSQKTVTSELGSYGFMALNPGTYTLTVQMPGFKEYVETDVPVVVNNVYRRNVTLQVGLVTETITVTSETAVLQTDRAEVRAELSNEGLENRASMSSTAHLASSILPCAMAFKPL